MATPAIRSRVASLGLEPVALAATSLGSHMAYILSCLLGQLATVNPEEWLRTLDQYAGPVGDLPRFYGNMLEQLLHGRPIKREALVPEASAGAGDAQPDLSRLLRRIESSPLVAGMPEPEQAQTEAGLLAALQAPEPPSAESVARMVHTLDQLLPSSSDRFRPLIESLFADRETADRLIARLPERVLTRLLYLLRPSAHAQAHRVADLLATAGTGPEWALDPASLRRTTWQLLFRSLIEEGRSFDVEAFVQRFVASLAHLSAQPDTASVRILLHRQLTHRSLLADSTDQRAITALSRMLNEETRSSATVMSDRDLVDDDESNCAEPIYIANAGQVLAAPFVSRLFALLNLTEGATFTDRKAAERGVHLLQFMVNERTDSPESQLVLNKILCGVRTGTPIERAMALRTEEREAIESMLRSMIQHWTVLGTTSIAGFRESFLQREGRLRFHENAWHVLVEARSFDMLLDQIPWSFSTIKYPWMERVLHVEWR